MSHKFTPDLASSIFDSDNRYVAGVIAHLIMMDKDDTLITSIGLLRKLNETDFRIEVTKDVYEQGAESIFSVENVIDGIFNQ